MSKSNLPKGIVRKKNSRGEYLPGYYSNFRGPDGKKIQKKLHDDLAKSKRALALLKDEIQAFVFRKESAPTSLASIHEVIEQWFDMKYGHRPASDGSKANHASWCRILKRAIPHTKAACDIDDELCRELLQAWCQEKITVGTIFTRFNVLFRIVNWHALHNDYDPAIRSANFKLKLRDAIGSPEVRERLLQPAEFVELCGTFKPGYIDLFWFALLTGRRRSELLTLRWCELQLDHQRRCGVARTQIKSRGLNKEWQTWPVSQHAYDVLAKQIIDGDPRHGEFVWTAPLKRKCRGHDKGEWRPITSRMLQKEWELVRELCSVRNLHWHDLRHTALTYAGWEGNMRLVKEMGGHRSSAMMERYLHALPHLRAQQATEAQTMMLEHLGNVPSDAPLSH